MEIEYGIEVLSLVVNYKGNKNIRISVIKELLFFLNLSGKYVWSKCWYGVVVSIVYKILCILICMLKVFMFLFLNVFCFIVLFCIFDKN